MSSPTSSETSSSLHSQIQSHLQEILTEENVPELDSSKLPESKFSTNHRTCGALNRIADPPRPSGNNPASYRDLSVDQKKISHDKRLSSDFSTFSDCGYSSGHLPKDSPLHDSSFSSTLKNCFLGRINSVLVGGNREFARVKDSSGKRTNLIYLFP